MPKHPSVVQPPEGVQLSIERVEADDELRTRIANAYGMWGSFLSHVMEASGAALDECAEHVGLKRFGLATRDPR